MNTEYENLVATAIKKHLKIWFMNIKDLSKEIWNMH